MDEQKKDTTLRSINLCVIDIDDSLKLQSKVLVLLAMTSLMNVILDLIVLVKLLK